MPNILVIDNNPYVRQYVRLALESAGHRVQEAADAAAGVQAYRQAPADVVVCDLMLPRQGGLGAIRELLLLDPAVKVVAVSGGGIRAGTDDLERARDLGAVATLTKPFGIDALLGAVRGALRG